MKGIAPNACGLEQENEYLRSRIADLESMQEKYAETLRTLEFERSLFYLLMNNLPALVYLKDTQSRFVSINRALAAHLGIKDPASAIGKTDFDFYPEELARSFFEDERRILETGNPVVNKVEKQNGKTDSARWTLTTKAPFRDTAGEIAGIVGISQDITERKMLDEALEREQYFMRILMENTEDLIYFKDSQGRFLKASRSIARRFGENEPESVIGKTDFEYFSPLHAQKAWDDELRLISGEVEKIKKDEEEIWPDGRVTWASTVKFPLKSGDGRIIGVFGVNRDITARKRALIALRKKNAALKRSNDELQQFAYVASHDLQEPLRMVSSYTQLLLRRYKGKLDGEADEFIEFAVDGAKRMQLLISDLLAFSRVETRGKKFEPCDMNRAFDGDLSMAAKEKNAKITRDDLPVINGDFSQMVQLFQNLIHNAIKFSGGRTPEIHATAVDEGDRYKFSVLDNGIGIAEEYFNRIFVIFQRLHGRDEYPGTGIGLAICKRIVVRHGGRIWVASEINRGATFYFELPQSRHDSIENE